MSEINTWQELRDAVGKWSVANFGSQRGLGCLAPLLGMCEEVGELGSADTPEDREDALGDILIFLMDYCYRAGVDLSSLHHDSDYIGVSVAAAVGKLHHVQLKRLQRIRGMEDTAVFRSVQLTAVKDVVFAVDRQTPVAADAFDIARAVWNTVVSKRQWNTFIGSPDRAYCIGDFSEIVDELHGLG